MAKYSLDEILQVWFPKNTRLTFNNVKDARDHIAVPSDSVRIYDVIKDTIEYLGITTSGTNTDITIDHNSSTVDVNSSTGADGTINAATTSLAGVMSASDKVNLQALITLSGVTAGSLHLGTFTGSTIPDNQTIKAALQAIETALEAVPALPSFGNLTSSTTAITVTNGTSVVKGAGTQLNIVPSNILLSTLGGSLSASQIASGGATIGQYMIFDGANWAPGTLIWPTHNTLGGLQGGSLGERYHLPQAVYNVLNSANTSTLIGRNDSTTGNVEFIAPTNSIEISGTDLQLLNDVASPGNDYFYGTNGSGTKGWYAISTGSVTEILVTDDADIDFTVTDPTTTPDITATLTATGVTPGTYGSATAIPSFTVDSKGRITSVSTFGISISHSNVSDWAEAVQDEVATLLVAGTDITLTYDDGANTLTIDSTAAGIGSGGSQRVSYWNTGGTTLTHSSNFLFDGTHLVVNDTSASGNSIIQTKGTTTGSLFYGYAHWDASDNLVFYVTDDGYISCGDALGTPIVIDNIGMYRDASFQISTNAGNLTLIPDNELYLMAPTGINTTTLGSNVLRVNGSTRFDLGSDDVGDTYYRNASGNFTRLPVGSNGDVLTLTAGIPSWVTPGAASLPSGSSGDILIHNGTSYASYSYQEESQTGITGTSITLAMTPIAFGTFRLYRNGVRQLVTDDFTRVGDAITLSVAAVTSDKFIAEYYI